MIKTTMRQILDTARDILRRRAALALFAALYAALLGSLYAFVTTREATIWQVLLTLLLVLATPVGFFALQAAIVDQALNNRVRGMRLGRTALKLAVATLPVVVAGAVLWVILNQLQSHFPGPSAPSWATATIEPASQNLHWPTLLFATLRWMLFGIGLPLATIHWWLAAANDAGPAGSRAFPLSGRRGTLSALRRAWRVLAQAFAPESVFTYTVGAILFAVIPYTLLFAPFPVRGARVDFVILITRLVFVFLLTLFGWVLTVTSLAREVGEGEAEADHVCIFPSPIGRGVRGEGLAS